MTNDTLLPVPLPRGDWGLAMRGFLREKAARSGSKATPATYEGVLSAFFGLSGKTPDQITSRDVFAWAYAGRTRARPPAAATIGVRLAAISSFFKFCVRMGLLDKNPCDAVPRPRPAEPPPRGLTAEEVNRLLSVMPDTGPGKRDTAIILWLVFTGRRRNEVLPLTAGDLSRNGGIYYTYRSKGGKTHTRELPPPVFAALVDALKAEGRPLESLGPAERLFSVSSHGFYLNLERHFRKAKLDCHGAHVLRHTAAKLRREAGESIEMVSSFLDHANLQVTTTYLRKLEGERDLTWQGVEKLLEGGNDGPSS